MIRRKNGIHFLLFLTTLAVVPISSLSSSTSPSPQEVAEAEVYYEDEVEFVDLAELSDAELENICITRGFELIPNTDPDTGEILVFTHDDYVEAAQQCLEVEKEMNQLIRRNPNVIQDLEKERERMQAAKEQLEAELLAKQAELQQKRKKGHQQAFVQNEQNQSEEDSNDLDEMNTSSATSPTATEGSDNNVDVDASSDTNNNSTNTPYQKYTSPKKIQPAQNGTISAGDSNDYNPLSIKTIVQESVVELRSKISRDFRIASDILLPPWIREHVLQKVVAPVIRITKTTGAHVLDMTKRYITILMSDLMEHQKTQKEQQKDL